MNGIEPPFRFEKLAFALLNCETPPTDPVFDPGGTTLYWEKRFLWADRVGPLLDSIARNEAAALVDSKEQLLVLLAPRLARRALEKGNRLEEKPPPPSRRLVTLD